MDFHWEVNGKTYDFSIPGGGFVSFTDLVEVLGIVNQDVQKDSNGEVNGNTSGNGAENVDFDATEETSIDNQDVTPLTLEDVVVSEDTRKFVADVEGITFSTPSLLSVSKVEESTTVGAIKDVLGLECEYSAELTEEQIAAINDTIVESGDWALISMQPFDTEEYLTVTMKNGEVFQVKVTDARDPLGLDGRTFSIVNQKNNTWYALDANATITLQNRGHYLTSTSVNYEKLNGTEYCDVNASGTTNASFTNHYKAKGDPIHVRVRVFHDGNWAHIGNSDNYREVYNDYIDSDSVKASIVIKAKPNGNLKYGVNSNPTTAVTWPSGVNGNNLNETTITANLPNGSKDVIIWIASSWDYKTNANFELVSLTGIANSNGRNGAPALRKAAAQKSIIPSDKTYEADTEVLVAPGLPADVGSGYEYTDDVSFSEGNTVTLTYGDWDKVVNDLPATDYDGNRYYYYIKSVEEEGMPSGVSISVKDDGGKKFIVGTGKNEGKPLELTNTVSTEPETININIRKLRKDGNTDLEGAVFQLSVKDTTAYRYVTATDGIEGLSTVTKGGYSYPAAFETDGTTKVLSKLKDGEYKLEEVHVPDGYVNTLGGIEFKIEDGQISGTNVSGKLTFDSNAVLITVTNEPGVALPNTGGSGTKLIYLAGAALTAIGLLMLRWKRIRE